VIRLLRTYVETRKGATPSSTVAILGLAGFFARVAVWTTVFLLVLDNFGIDITALITGLGIGGIAVALAVQNVLSDTFASISIILDKPFEVGDFIIVGDLLGVVENIGIKTTRVRSLSGEQLVFGNNDLLSSRIRNFKRMYERRVAFGFGVLYETPIEKLEWIPGMVREGIEALEQTRFDRAHFKGFGESSLDFEIVYYVLAPDYALYMDIQQKINLHIMREFAREGVDFAYPTRMLHVKRAGREDAKAEYAGATPPASPRGGSGPGGSRD
jgi:small-conductance mechanosensitive channel